MNDTKKNSLAADLPPAYLPADYEADILRQWEASVKTNPDNLASDEPYSIVLPPPNVTGTLHLGHAVMLAIEDIIIRYQRMLGKKTLWVPGTDHAAIATQTKVEKILLAEGKTNPRAELGRDQFLQRVEKFAAASRATIVNQAKRMGASLDWSREAYTLDAVRSRAVRLTFKKMFDDGLIYRGHRIVNWCPRCQSTLADDEVEYREEATPFYYFKYGPVVIGTARPETKFLDKTIAVHPDDPRYLHIHNKRFQIDWLGGQLEANVITDPIVDREFGTGAMTLTPAHSIEDFALAQKYSLPIVQIIDEAGNFTAAAGTFAGRNARDSRAAIVEQLRAKGLVDHIDEDYRHNLSICYRCGTAIEPLTKLQWFINVNKSFIFHQSSRRPIAGVADGQSLTLKQLMRQVVETEQIIFVPDRFRTVYYQWIDNLRDWNISRQIWFGHRLPVWYDAADKQRYVVAESAEEARLALKTKTVEQDPDTLDTWFSAGIWTWSSLLNRDPALLKQSNLTVREWAEQSPDIMHYHPTAVLETGYDIIFFWVARMILMTTYALGEVPFRTVYLHGLVRDELGRKMSKSLNNSIDPLDMISQYGTDALRLALVVGTTPGNDSKLYPSKIAGFRNFVNKVWNVSRYVLRSAIGDTPPYHQPSLADQWIKSRLALVVEEVTTNLEQYQFSQAAERAYDFLWHELADWYVEINKIQPNPTLTRQVLETTLKLLHPFIPFVTEVIWQEFHPDTLLFTTPWPLAHGSDRDATVEDHFTDLQDSINRLRQMRTLFKINYSICLIVYPQNKLSTEEKIIIAKFAKVQFMDEPIQQRNCYRIGNKTFWLEVVLPDNVIKNIPPLKQKIVKDIQNLQSQIERTKQMLVNSSYQTKAPIEIIEKETTKQTEREATLEFLKGQVVMLEQMAIK